jgi:hypothetical protein
MIAQTPVVPRETSEKWEEERMINNLIIRDAYGLWDANNQ